MARNRRPASARRRWAVALLLPVLLAHPAAAEVSVEVLKAERMFPGNNAFIDNSEASSRINAVVRLPSGNTLVSLRNFHMLVEVDRSGAVVWKRAGLPRVHDPAPLPNGNLLVSLLVRPNYPPVREITRTGETVWEFSQSDVLAPTTVMPLPNGNVLIAGQNKIVEVTRDKEVVWRVVLRGVRPSNDDTERHIYKAVRIPAPAR